MESQEVDWNEIESLVILLSKKLKKLSRTFSSITTISRDGLIPARLIADQLDIKKIHVDKRKISSDSLFVDDIYDSGRTFEQIIPNVDNPSELVFVTLFARRGKSYPLQLIYAKKNFESKLCCFPLG